MAVQEKRTKFFYSIALSPTSRLEWIESNGDIIAEISSRGDQTVNNKLAELL